MDWGATQSPRPLPDMCSWSSTSLEPLATGDTIKKQAAKACGDFFRIAFQCMPWKKLIGQKVAPQHPCECPGRNASVHIAKAAFNDAAVDQLLDHSDESADKLVIECIGQRMALEGAMIVEAQKNRIECLRKSGGNKSESLLDGYVSALGGINDAHQFFVLKFLAQNRREKALLAGKMAKNKGFIHTRTAGDGRSGRSLEASRRKEFSRRSENPIAA